MLIGLTIAYLLMHFGSDSSALLWPYEETEKRIKQYVADEVRQKQALGIVEQMKAANETYVKERESSVDALLKLLSVREAPIAAIERSCQPLIAEDQGVAENLLTLRFQLKSVLTPAEWTKVFPAPTATAAIARKSS